MTNEHRKRNYGYDTIEAQQRKNMLLCGIRDEKGGQIIWN